MTSRSEARCPTTSGPYVCTVGQGGHAGPCETTEPAPPWVGPALQPSDVRIAVATVRRRHERELAEAERQLRRAEARARALEARHAMPHIVTHANGASRAPITSSDGSAVVPKDIAPKNITRTPVDGASRG